MNYEKNYQMAHKWLSYHFGKANKCSSSGRLQLDHIIPLFKGGINTMSNVQILCIPCHKHKTKTENRPV